MKKYSPPTVHILLATYQGAEHVEEQLNSIATQTHQRWKLLISDDGSEDGTIEIINKFIEKHPGKAKLISGPSKGATKNFFNLIEKVQNDKETDLFAFCDQDDSWLPTKLEAAINLHKKHETEKKPVLYCGRTIITNNKLKKIGLSEIPKQPLSFKNALIQNIASGNTMVFNKALFNILIKIPPGDSAWHDWTAYIVATACGGIVYYDKQPQILYRQHLKNVVGSRNGLGEKLLKLRSIFKGMYKIQGNLIERTARDIVLFMPHENRKTMETYLLARHAESGFDRVKYLKESKVYRQKTSEQIALYVLTYLGLI